MSTKDTDMGQLHEFWRSITGANEKSVVPPQYGTDGDSKTQLYIIVGFGIFMVLFGATVAFIGLF